MNEAFIGVLTLLLNSTPQVQPALPDKVTLEYVGQHRINKFARCYNRIGCYSPVYDTIYVLDSLDAKTSEWVVAHEQAHFIVKELAPEAKEFGRQQHEDLANALVQWWGIQEPTGIAGI